MDENTKSLQGLSKTLYRSGVLPIFLGVLICFIGVVQQDTANMAVGLFVFIVGYSYVKIAQKISKIIK